MEQHKGVDTYYAQDRAAWHQWLADNHAVAQSVWLIIYKQGSDVPSVYYPEAVDEALCFGWIDSTPNKRDAHSYYQFFARRSPKSNWSRVNKQKIAHLTQEGRMQPAGHAMVALAQRNGTWTALDDVENLVLPDDLRARFDQYPTALAHWEGFPRSAKRGILEWIFNAKRPATRQQRIEETVRLAQQNIRANSYP